MGAASTGNASFCRRPGRHASLTWMCFTRKAWASTNLSSRRHCSLFREAGGCITGATAPIPKRRRWKDSLSTHLADCLAKGGRKRRPHRRRCPQLNPAVVRLPPRTHPSFPVWQCRKRRFIESFQGKTHGLPRAFHSGQRNVVEVYGLLGSRPGASHSARAPRFNVRSAGCDSIESNLTAFLAWPVGARPCRTTKYLLQLDRHLPESVHMLRE